VGLGFAGRVTGVKTPKKVSLNQEVSSCMGLKVLEVNLHKGQKD